MSEEFRPMPKVYQSVVAESTMRMHLRDSAKLSHKSSRFARSSINKAIPMKNVTYNKSKLQSRQVQQPLD